MSNISHRVEATQRFCDSSAFRMGSQYISLCWNVVVAMIRVTSSKKLGPTIQMSTNEKRKEGHLLGCTVHKIELTAMVHDGRYDRVMPQLLDGGSDGF